MAHVEELLEFLSLSSRSDVREAAMGYIRGMTAKLDSQSLFHDERFVKSVAEIARDMRFPPIAHTAFVALVNLSAEDRFHASLIDSGVVPLAAALTCEPKTHYPDDGCMLLANITRNPKACEILIDLKDTVSNKSIVHRLVDIFCQGKGYNKHGTFDHLALAIFNITQVEAGRKLLLLRSDQGEQLITCGVR
jgi:hypothetical protein